MKIGKKIVIAILIVFGILSMIIYKLPITGKFEAISGFENSDLSGEILSAKYDPKEPKILERLTITAVVKNNGKEKNNYLLELKITKNGQLKYGDEFTFSLPPGNEMSFSPTYTPDDFGDHTIFLRLHDKNKTKVYDEKILTFVAQSDVGPFDLEVDLPSHIIGLGDSLPVTILITNMGARGSDIGLNLDLYCRSCVDSKKISKSIQIFLNGSSDVKKQFFLRTSGDVGMHVLVASIVLYDRELVSSKNQFYVNATMPKILISTQYWIKAEAGKKTIFGIEITNENGVDIKNIKPFIYGIPPDWISIEPSSFNILKPTDSVVFTATLDVPENAEIKSYETVIGIGSDNAFSKKEVILSITGAVTVFELPSTAYGFLSNYWIHIVLIVALIVVLFLFYKSRRKGQGQDRRTILRKIRDVTT